MWLLLAAPQVAYRSCEDCLVYVYDEQTGLRAEHPRGSGQPVRRPQATFPPCGYGGDKCPKGSPTAGRELTERNAQAYRHDQECRAVGRFPEDAIVRRNAAIIAEVLRSWERVERRLLRDMLLAACGAGRFGR